MDSFLEGRDTDRNGGEQICLTPTHLQVPACFITYTASAIVESVRGVRACVVEKEVGGKEAKFTLGRFLWQKGALAQHTVSVCSLSAPLLRGHLASKDVVTTR